MHTQAEVAKAVLGNWRTALTMRIQLTPPTKPINPAPKRAATIDPASLSGLKLPRDAASMKPNARTMQRTSVNADSITRIVAAGSRTFRLRTIGMTTAEEVPPKAI